MSSYSASLLPTPCASDNNAAGTFNAARKVVFSGKQIRLSDRILTLIGTPTAAFQPRSQAWQQGAKAPNPAELAEKWNGTYGRYQHAITRWETTLSRQAPSPVEPHPTKPGENRLNAKFVEWLMGLPEGWVTNVPHVKRRAQIKALGNGVVPQQAIFALEHLLNDQ